MGYQPWNLLCKTYLYGGHIAEEERKVAVEERTKAFPLLQLSVFFLRYGSFSEASKTTLVYIILKEL